MPLSVDFPIIISFLSRQPEHRLKMNSNNQSKGEWHPLFFHHAVSCTGCARDIACVLNHTKRVRCSGIFQLPDIPAVSCAFFILSLPAFRPAKSAFELFHNALPGQCNRKSGHYIEERRKCSMPPALSPEPTACGLFPNVSGGASRPRYFPFWRGRRKTAGEEGGKPSMENSPPDHGCLHGTSQA